MIDFRISWLPFIMVGILNFLLSWLYYSPMVPWFKTWVKGIGGDVNKTEMTDEDKKSMPRLMGGAFIGTFLFSYGLQILIHSMKITGFGFGLMAGLVVWFGFAVTHSLNTQFEGRKPIVLLINNIFYMLTYGLFGGLIAILG